MISFFLKWKKREEETQFELTFFHGIDVRAHMPSLSLSPSLAHTTHISFSSIVYTKAFNCCRYTPLQYSLCLFSHLIARLFFCAKCDVMHTSRADKFLAIVRRIFNYCYLVGRYHSHFERILRYFLFISISLALRSRVAHVRRSNIPNSTFHNPHPHAWRLTPSG